MKTVRDACVLQPNALSIRLSDQIEQLDELIKEEGDGTAFFKGTHVTLGMQDFISEGIARLAGAGQTLTPLGAYWKGRKPLILNKACILGCLLPASDDIKRDLEIFEKLMAMDDESFAVRYPRRPRPKEILERASISCISDYFEVSPPVILPESAPVDWSNSDYVAVNFEWREDLSEMDRRRLEAQILPLPNSHLWSCKLI